jgi:TRAP-type C4-dicarboxylate transport system substrate-binding protein
MTKRLLLVLALACTTALSPLAVTAEQLAFGTANAEMHPLNKLIMIPWAEDVNARANGAVTLNLRHGPALVSGANAVDRVQDGVVQLAFAMTQFNPGRFPRSLITSMPFIEGSAETLAVAYCAMYQQGVLDAEMASFQPLFFVPFPQSSAHVKGTALTSLTALAGKKIMVGSPTAAGVVTAMGGTPLSIIVPEQYQALQRGTADGNFMTFTAFPAFNLTEVTSDHLEVPLGGAMGMVFMDKARFDALPEAARAALTATPICDKTREVGAIVDKWEASSRGMVAAAGHTISTIDPAELAQVRADIGEKLLAEFVQRTPDGQAVLDAWLAAMETARAQVSQ